jgi:CRISPR/Cas system-associated exonuclease Cas4 (RecB family)
MNISQNPNEYIYSLFSRVYYEHEIRDYNNNQCSTTESVQCFGTITHNALQRYLREDGYQTEVEKAIPIGDIELFTHTDALRDKHALEIKTSSMMIKAILPQHFLQTNVYMFAHNIEEAYVAYIHKPSGIVNTLPMHRSEESFQTVVFRAVRLCKNLQSNVLPIAEPSWLCRFCEYLDKCPEGRAHKESRGRPT